MIVTLALSLCTSQMLSNCATVSPGFTNHSLTVTSLMPSPMSESVNWTISRLGRDRWRLLASLGPGAEGGRRCWMEKRWRQAGAGDCCEVTQLLEAARHTTEAGEEAGAGARHRRWLVCLSTWARGSKQPPDILSLLAVTG